MKSSGRGAKRRTRFTKCLIVDGYNIIGRLHSSSLANIVDMDSARDQLIELLADYGSFHGVFVILVFDAYHTPSATNQEVRKGVQIIFTGPQETADERIERLVYELRDVYREITVATSDIAEQQVTFGGGALRISASEFIRKLEDGRQEIRETVVRKDDSRSGRGTLSDHIRQDVANILEKWRRQ